MNIKILRFICISLLMVCCVNFQILQVQAGTTKVILHKAEQQDNSVKEKGQRIGSIKTRDENHTAVYLVPLLTAAVVCGRKVKKIKSEEEV